MFAYTLFPFGNHSILWFGKHDYNNATHSYYYLVRQGNIIGLKHLIYIICTFGKTNLKTNK